MLEHDCTKRVPLEHVQFDEEYRVMTSPPRQVSFPVKEFRVGGSGAARRGMPRDETDHDMRLDLPQDPEPDGNGKKLVSEVSAIEHLKSEPQLKIFEMASQLD
jgi:hypothetical protein